jgi:SpoVK/Ycf46/Vps4 family AAA+-type ATPase
MNQVELNNLQSDAYDHLWNGRFRLALKNAKTLYSNRPEDSEAAICYAWALLENGYPTKAMEFANLAVELKGDSVRTHLCRGYILMRLSIFEGAISDLDQSIEEQKTLLSWSYMNKARTLAGMGKFNSAKLSLKLCQLIDKDNETYISYQRYYDTAEELEKEKGIISTKKAANLIKLAKEALEDKEAWFPLYISKLIFENKKLDKLFDDALLLEMEASLHQCRFRPALKSAEKASDQLKKNKHYKKVLSSLEKMKDDDSAEEDLPLLPPVVKTRIDLTDPDVDSKKDENKKTSFAYYDNDNAEVFSVKLFDMTKFVESKERIYCQQFDIAQIKEIGVEVIFGNPNFRQKTKQFNCIAKWYLNDYEVYTNDFNLEVDKNWDSVIFNQQCGIDEDINWSIGQCRVDIYIENYRVCEKWFFIDQSTVEEVLPNTQSKDTPQNISENKDEEKPESEYPVSTKTLEELLNELDSFIGLENIKESVRTFISFLQFQKERESKGLKSNNDFSAHAIFTGNPGTGKTTIARLLGDIFRTLGILKRGHIVEVDRVSLVGQYVGETAQKTEKLIQDAKGGVLFIDEAYSLVKKGGSGQDFGQEAIDTLLKRMEDHKGEFVVFAAGYTEEMEDFVNSNPGLKSRFTHTFNFEDYTPEELLKILDLNLNKDEYKIEKSAKEAINKFLIKEYRARDKSFGNARLVRQLVEGIKLEVANRVGKLKEDEKTEETLSTIKNKDIENVLKTGSEKKAFIPINEEELESSLKQLDSLTGLESVKSEIHDLVKLVRYFISKGDDVQEKFNSHILFLGNPGTGKTTVARIVSKIYSALGILPRGHLVETDRQGLVATHIGGTAEKTTSVINKSIGGTLFIDEAYTLASKDASSQDFGKEAIDTLLKRMEDDRGKFIVIAAGYTDEMKSFIESNPGIDSRFTKSITFDDYIPDELMEITEGILGRNKIKLEENAKTLLTKHFHEIYRSRDKHFGNARVVRNLVDKAIQRRLLRLAELPSEKRQEKESDLLVVSDIEEALGNNKKQKQYNTKGDPEKLESLLRQLDQLTGLSEVKLNVNKLISSLKVNKLRKERGLKVIDKQLHSVFIGNPGTGKTTVARLISKIYKELGIIERGHLVEVDRSDLVAGYQGQTAIKTDKIITEALGGTLFIDEAYTLSRGGNDFGQEAIDTLLKQMEDKRGELIVIVAGYTNEMHNFLESNPGLQSRFNNTFTFEDYTPRELLYIAADIADDNGYRLDEGALQILLEIFDKLYSKRDRNFGNARTARNILYQAISNQEQRISKMFDYTDDDLMSINYEDVKSIKIES